MGYRVILMHFQSHLKGQPLLTVSGFNSSDEHLPRFREYPTPAFLEFSVLAPF